jgi:acyl dehydratase
MIRRFTEATTDPNPLWQDSEETRKGPYKGMVAPPGFLYSINHMGRPGPFSLSGTLPFEVPPTGVDGGIDWEFFQPVRPGDVITATIKIADITERKNLLFIHYQFECKNQKGELVSSGRRTVIRY